MTPANWTDLLATLRFVFEHVLQIATVVTGAAAAYYAYRSKAVGDQNSGHLAKQDRSIAAVADKVKELVAITPDDHLKARVNSLANDLKAIRREAGPGG